MVLCGNVSATAAQEVSEDTIGGKVHHIDEVTVRTRRSFSNMTATAPTLVMDRSLMEQMGMHEVAEAVKHFSGVSVKDYGGIGGLKTISVRSLGAQHTGVCYDGIAISDCQSGQIDISRFSLDNVSLLYFTIGQSDNIYLSAKTFASAGTLSIETMRPDLDQRSYQLNVNLKAGSYGLANPSLMYQQRIHPKVSLSAYADYLRADGNYPFELRNGTERIEGKRNNSDIETWRAELNAYIDINDRQNINLKAYLFDSERGLPGGVVYDNPYAAERLYDRNYFAQAAYENRFSEHWKLKAGGKFNYTWNRDRNDQASGITDDRYRQTETYLTATLWGEPVEHLSFSLAQDFAYNDLSATLRNCQFPERFTYLTAAAVRYAHPLFTASASLLNTHIHERVETGDASEGFRRLSPAFSLSWKPFRENLRVRLSYKDIFRVPTFNDMYYLLIGNVNLRPESTRQWNVGVTYNRSFSNTLEHVTLTADGYYGTVKDKIVAVPTMFVWRMSNVGEVKTLGLDLNATAALKWTETWKTSLRFAYSFMQAEDVTERDSQTWHNQIAYTPRHSGSSSCSLSTPWLELTYNVLYAGERYSSGYNSNDNRLSAYTDHSLSLSKKIKWKHSQLRIQAEALNLGGKNYEVIRFYPMPGRNYKVTINYQF